VATRLLQRYGYLVPKLNPDSRQLGSTRRSSANEDRSSYAPRKRVRRRKKTQTREKAHIQIERAKACDGEECAERDNRRFPSRHAKLHRKPEVPIANGANHRGFGSSEFRRRRNRILDLLLWRRCDKSGRWQAAVASDLTIAEPSKASSTDRKPVSRHSPRQRKTKMFGTHEIACKDEPVRGHTSLYDMYVQASASGGLDDLA